jgi:hypothetical protein
MITVKVVVKDRSISMAVLGARIWLRLSSLFFIFWLYWGFKSRPWATLPALFCDSFFLGGI